MEWLASTTFSVCLPPTAVSANVSDDARMTSMIVHAGWRPAVSESEQELEEQEQVCEQVCDKLAC